MDVQARQADRSEPLSKSVLARIGQNVFRCYQCVKCSAGCPLAEQFDLRPNQVMRSLQFDDSSVLHSKAIWLCAGCQTCSTRCPQGIDVVGVMDALRIEARRRDIPSALPEIDQFNRLFMRFVRWFGRLPELIFILTYKLIRRRPFADSRMGLRMLRKGKLVLMPHYSRTPKKVEALEDPVGKVGYFPGCAASSTSKEYDLTVRSTADALGIELVEPPGWVCCGSSCAHSVDKTESVVLPLRSMATVERLGLSKITSPCSNCFFRLKTAESGVAEDETLLDEVEKFTNYRYQGTVGVQHFVDTIMDHATPAQIAEKVKRPLDGLTVACYYGCLITRPSNVTQAEHPEYPMKMDYLLQSLGAETVDWSFKTDCCGGSLSVTQPEMALGMSADVLENARDYGAEAVITMCPMCHMNLDARQQDMELGFEMPVFHSTQLATFALGLDLKASHLDKNLVDPYCLLRSKSLI
jgi:heterodisulfide reductase subunit B